MRAAALMLVLAAAACSNLGFGKVIPGARPRFGAGKQFAIQDLGNGWYRMGALGPEATEVGGGRLGAVVGGRLGLGSTRVGDQVLTGGGFDVRGELLVEVTPWLGLGASIGYGADGMAAGDREASRSGFPLLALATVTPLRPFVLRAGPLVEPGTTEVDGITTSVTRYGFDAAAGIAVAFRGRHFVVLVDWRHATAGDVMTAAGRADATTDLYLLDAWVAL